MYKCDVPLLQSLTLCLCESAYDYRILTCGAVRAEAQLVQNSGIALYCGHCCTRLGCMHGLGVQCGDVVKMSVACCQTCIHS